MEWRKLVMPDGRELSRRAKRKGLRLLARGPWAFLNRAACGRVMDEKQG